MKKYAISDIHGCAKTFQQLLRKITLSKEDELYLLGDYIDRGPDSKGVIDTIWQLQADGYQVHCLRGNHEQMLLDCEQTEIKFLLWERNGGTATMKSFNTRLVSKIPTKYTDWMHSIPYYFEVDQYILVHAGFRFDMPNPLEEKKSMLWERNWYHRINTHWLNDRIIIHGHTPTIKEEIIKMRINVQKLRVLDIDNGCCFFPRAGYGALCAVELQNLNFTFQPNIDMI